MLAVACGSVSLAALALYALVTGAAHASRYLIWVFAMLAVPAAWSLSEATQGRRGVWAKRGAAIGALWMAGVIGADNTLRTRNGSFGPNAWGHGADFVFGKPERRKETTDALLDAAGPQSPGPNVSQGAPG